MTWIPIVIAVLILVFILGSFIGMWTSNSDPLSDYELWGNEEEEDLNR